MKETMVFTGGARLGWVKATWPFGRLTVSSGELTVSLALAGRYRFTPAEVSGFEPFGPRANGIRIVHTRSDCPKTIVFWYGNRQRVLDAAMRAGFDARVTSSSTPRRGMPFRWIVVLGLAQLIGGFLLARMVLQILF